MKTVSIETQSLTIYKLVNLNESGIINNPTFNISEDVLARYNQVYTEFLKLQDQLSMYNTIHVGQS